MIFKYFYYTCIWICRCCLIVQLWAVALLHETCFYVWEKNVSKYVIYVLELNCRVSVHCEVT